MWHPLCDPPGSCKDPHSYADKAYKIATLGKGNPSSATIPGATQIPGGVEKGAGLTGSAVPKESPLTSSEGGGIPRPAAGSATRVDTGSAKSSGLGSGDPYGRITKIAGGGGGTGGTYSGLTKSSGSTFDTSGLLSGLGGIGGLRSGGGGGYDAPASGLAYVPARPPNTYYDRNFDPRYPLTTFQPLQSTGDLIKQLADDKAARQRVARQAFLDSVSLDFSRIEKEGGVTQGPLSRAGARFAEGVRSVAGGISEFFVSTFQPFSEKTAGPAGLEESGAEGEKSRAGDVRRRSIEVLAVETGVPDEDTLVPAGSEGAYVPVSGIDISPPADEDTERGPISGAELHPEAGELQSSSSQEADANAIGALFAPSPVPLTLFADADFSSDEERTEITELPGFFAKIITKAIGTSFSAIAEAILGGLRSIFSWF
ncbi:MAG: hypothetical protein HY460_02235 [Parcubacteria group bacterium]|nr:hypothetical protein [Parcubacteria group bacterium]